jgi:hypothetical protein
MIGFAVALLSELAGLQGWQRGSGLLLVGGLAYALAAIVVWSDVPWPGDPE